MAWSLNMRTWAVEPGLVGAKSEPQPTAALLMLNPARPLFGGGRHKAAPYSCMARHAGSKWQ